MSTTSRLRATPAHAVTSSIPIAVRYAAPGQLRRYMIMYGLAIFAIAAVWGGVGGILLPLHVQEIAFAQLFTGANAGVNLHELNQLKAQVAAHSVQPGALQLAQLELLARFDAARASGLSFVTTIGMLATMIMQPVAGLMSDRTRSRRGRRAPWIILGALITLAALLAAQYASSMAMLALMWACAGIGTNMAAGPLAASIPDRVPADKTGALSAVAGVGTLIGFVSGTVAGGALFNHVGTSSYIPFGVVVALLCLLFVKTSPDLSSERMALGQVSIKTHLAGLTLALRDHDFRWLWFGKVISYFGYATSTTFGVYMLQSYVQPALSQQEAARIAPLIHLAAFPGTLVAMYLAGRWSDAIGRRKPFVIGSTLLMAASMLIPLLSPTVAALFAQAIIGNIALGAFLVVDQAMFIDVLPDKEAAGRDLGVSALGGNLGQALGPAIAGMVVALTGGYAGVWCVAIVLGIFSAVVVLSVKNAR